MSDHRLHTCFISAPFSVDTAPLRDALSARGVMSRDDASVLTGTFARRTLESAIADVDFVCAVIPDNPPDPNVYLELGVAIGKGRPLLLFVAPKANLPAALRGHSYARASLKDTEALSFHLDAFLKNARKNEEPLGDGQQEERRLSDPTALQAALARLATWEGEEQPPSERDLLTFLSGVFEAAGWITSTSSASIKRGNSRADLAVWIDELQPTVGNPILIEVVGRAAETARKAHKFGQLLTAFQSSLGVLVRWGQNGGPATPLAWPSPIIVEMGVRELVESVAQGEFPQALLKRRHAAVHAGSQPLWG